MSKSPDRSLRWFAIIFVVALATPTVIDLLFAAVPRGWEGRGLGPPLSTKGSVVYLPSGSKEPKVMRYEFWLSHDSETGVATNTHAEAFIQTFPIEEVSDPVLSEAEVQTALRRAFDTLCQKDGYPQLASAFKQLRTDGRGTGGRVTIDHEERRALVSWRWFLVSIKQLCGLTMIVSGIVFVALLPGWFAARRAKTAGCCRRCGYDLKGIATGMCPECGTRWT